MDKASAPQLASILNSLAEVFDRKPPTLKAVEIWFETLRDFETNRVFSVLNNWPKSNAKFPTPADVWKKVNEQKSVSTESALQAKKEGLDKAYSNVAATDYGRNKFAEIMEMLKRPKPTPRQHWKQVLSTDGLPDATYAFANASMAKIGRRTSDE